MKKKISCPITNCYYKETSKTLEPVSPKKNLQIKIDRKNAQSSFNPLK